ncbi:MAG: ATP-binding protein, partial [Lachnospiraceae bacterium]|nr:ATP-binding protein [Lachnospiraceae bacterium]
MGLTNSQYDEIMRDYQRRQNQVRQELSMREQEVYRKIPAFAGLDAQIAAISTACARDLLEGAPSIERDAGRSVSMGEEGAAGGLPEQTKTGSEVSSLSGLRAQIRDISRRKEKLLRDAGYPADYLAPRYHCPDCQDTGYIGAEKCHCFRQAAIDLLYTQSNLRENMKEEEFPAFSLDYYPDTMTDPVTGLSAAQMAARALDECKRFVREFDKGADNIFLSGDTGLGKTFLSHCVANALLETTHSVIYFSAFRLFDLLADSSFGRVAEGGMDEMERHIFDCDLLIIDDLGT